MQQDGHTMPPSNNSNHNNNNSNHNNNNNTYYQMWVTPPSTVFPFAMYAHTEMQKKKCRPGTFNNNTNTNFKAQPEPPLMNQHLQTSTFGACPPSTRSHFLTRVSYIWGSMKVYAELICVYSIKYRGEALVSDDGVRRIPVLSLL